MHFFPFHLSFCIHFILAHLLFDNGTKHAIFYFIQKFSKERICRICTLLITLGFPKDIEDPKVLESSSIELHFAKSFSASLHTAFCFVSGESKCWDMALLSNDKMASNVCVSLLETTINFFTIQLHGYIHLSIFHAAEL